MSRYHFTLSGGEVTVLYENDQPLYTVSTEPGGIHFIDERGDRKGIVRFSPSLDFWKKVVRINEYSSRFTEEYKHLNLPEEVVPDPLEWGCLHFPKLPQYEARVLQQIQQTMIHHRLETNRVFDEYDSLRRLFNTAYSETSFAVPEYLTAIQQ